MWGLFAMGTITTRRLRAKVLGASAATCSDLTTTSICAWLADAKTSAGAPLVICADRSCDPAKLNVTFVPGLADSKFLPTSVNDSVRDAAAKTISSVVPEAAGAVVAAAVAAAVGAGALGAAVGTADADAVVGVGALPVAADVLAVAVGAPPLGAAQALSKTVSRKTSNTKGRK